MGENEENSLCNVSGAGVFILCVAMVLKGRAIAHSWYANCLPPGACLRTQDKWCGLQLAAAPGLICVV